jgi:hypothetical protein
MSIVWYSFLSLSLEIWGLSALLPSVPLVQKYLLETLELGLALQNSKAVTKPLHNVTFDPGTLLHPVPKSRNT